MLNLFLYLTPSRVKNYCPNYFQQCIATKVFLLVGVSSFVVEDHYGIYIANVFHSIERASASASKNFPSLYKEALSC